MPLKSWALVHDGHIVRAEIWWRLAGWNRKRVYVDHNRLVSVRGRFTARRPMLVALAGDSTPGESIAIRFKPRWFRLDMDCEVSSGGGSFAPVRKAFVDKHWQVSGWDVDHEPQSGRNLGCLILFPMLLFAVLILPLLGIVSGIVYVISNSLWRRRLRRGGRYISWEEIETQMRSLNSSCTLIRQMGDGAGSKYWWTPHDVATTCPLPIATEFDLFKHGPSEHPFISWCHGKYLHDANGTAFLTDPPFQFTQELERFDDGNARHQIHDRYNLLSTINTRFPTRQSIKVSTRFCEIMGNNLELSLPSLIEASGDQSPELRRLCLRSIAFLGERASSVVDRLKDRFYFGAEADRHLIAKTLAELGATGVEVLNWAQYSGDPRIRGHAQSAIRSHSRPAKPTVQVPKPRVPIEPEKKKKRIWRGRLSNLLYFISNAAVIALIVASGWYLGTIVTLVIFAALAVSAVGIFAGLQFWKIKKRTKKRLAEVAATSPSS